MSDDSSSPADLGMDLAKSFQPSWAQESDSKERISRMVARHGDDDRPERAGKFRDRERGPGRSRQSQGETRGRDRRDDRKPGGRDRRDDGKRGGRHSEQRQAPPPELEGWSGQIQPNRPGVEGLARQIKSGAKAYPLFDLARLVLEKPERYLVEFQRIGADSPALFQLRADGSIWLSEAEAISHALARHVEKFYRRERVATEAPKGNFSSVAVCGFSGELLGPSNHHAYQDNLRRLHAKRFAHMSFEAYKSRVRMEKDEAILARWKEEQSTTEVFYPLESPGTPAPEAPAAPPEAAPENPAPEGGDAETPVTTPEAAPVEASEAGKLASLEEVTRHFRANHAAREIVAIRDRVKVPGPAAINGSAPVVHNLVRRACQELQRFPLPLAHLIGQQLTSLGLQIFKAHDNITYVSIARPQYLDRVTTPVSEALSAMMEYLEANPSVPRADQWKALVALRPATEGGEAQRDSAVAADLAWLLHGGHVIDFASRGLQAARRPSARQGRQSQPSRQPEQ